MQSFPILSCHLFFVFLCSAIRVIEHFDFENRGIYIYMKLKTTEAEDRKDSRILLSFDTQETVVVMIIIKHLYQQPYIGNEIRAEKSS